MTNEHRPASRPATIGSELERVLMLPFDLWQEPGHYVVDVEMAGIRSQDLTVKVHGRTLDVSISLERELSRGEPGAIVEEHHAGSATRSLVFAEPIDTLAVRASLENGKLHVVLPIGTQGPPRLLDIAVR